MAVDAVVVVAGALPQPAVAVVVVEQLPQAAHNAVAHRRQQLLRQQLLRQQLLRQQLQFLLFQRLRRVTRPIPTPQPLQQRAVAVVLAVQPPALPQQPPVVDSEVVPEAVPLRQLAAQPHQVVAAPQHRLLARR